MNYTDSQFISDLILCIKADEAVSRDRKNNSVDWQYLNYREQARKRNAIARAVHAREFTPARPR